MASILQYTVDSREGIRPALFNHPNFGPPTNYMTSTLFAQATQILGASLGAGGQTGGLNPFYQIGGPRSAQLR